MNEEKVSSKRESPVSAEPESVESASGQMTEDEMDEAVGGVGAIEEQAPRNKGSSGRGWWHNPNE